MKGYRRIVMHRRALVNLVDGSAIEGVVWNERGPLVVLRDALLHSPQASDATRLDGEVIVDRSRIAFVQVAS